jgi:predicted DNA-binding protein
MPSPKISFRLPEETYKMLLKLAEVEKKTIAELSRDLIETGLGKRSTIEQDLLDEMRMMRIEMGELTARAVKASGHAAAYALLATRYTNETQHYTVTQGQTLDEETKKQRQLGWEKYAREIAEKFLTRPFEKL